MHKHRIFIIVAAALTIISSFLPWGSFNAGAFGSYSVSGTHGGDGWFIIVLSIGAIVLACLSNIDRKSTRLNSSHVSESRMPSSA